MTEISKAHTAITKACGILQSPPDLTVSEWADRYRVLSQEDSAEPGKWNTSRAEYQRGIMDAFSDPDVELIVVMSSAQIGKTQILNNILGYYVSLDPCPILIIMPTDQLAEDYSKERLAPMIRDTAVLKDKIKDVKAKNSNNTILRKKFPGGFIAINGANAPSKLASKPIRIVLIDEVDRNPLSSGTEGDPVKLAFKRTANFFNRKKALFSTPGIKGQSRIEKAFEESDKRYYHVPCPKCKQFQKLMWGQVKFEKENPDAAYYECGHCQAKLNDVDRLRMIKKGKWIAEAEFKGVAGFHLNALYSPWAKLKEIVQEFLEAKKDTEQLKTWVNTTLGETWEEEGETVDETSLINRVEAYQAQVPQGGIVLTAAADVQADRIECEVVAWGTDYESWSVDYKTFYGDTKEKAVWTDLDHYLQKDFTHASGIKLSISCAAVDSGYNTNEVYEFCRGKERRRIYAVKGQAGANLPVIGRASKIKYGKNPVKTINLFNIGVDQAKTTIYNQLQKTLIGAGYCHFPNTYAPEYFDMLTAEKAVAKYYKGFKKIEWKKIRERNEALDIRVYNLAMIKLLNPEFEKIAEKMGLNLSGETLKEKVARLKELNSKKTKPAKRKQGGFVKGWR